MEILISCPVLIPPEIPPELFDKYPSGVISSLDSDPFEEIRPKPFPISNPLTALMLIKPFAKSASSLSNNSGGISGGISTGQEIKISIALKPTSSISKEGQTIDADGESKQIQVQGRHDPCVGVRATPIAEAMTALVIMDHYLRNRAQNADVITEIPDLS